MEEHTRQFVIEATMWSLMSVELCSVAIERASRDQVKALAQSALHRHCEIANLFVDAALGHGLPVPGDFGDEHREEMCSLLTLSGEEFDRTFLEALLREDERNYFFYAEELVQGGEPDIGKIAAQTLPLLSEELNALRAFLNRGGSDDPGGKTE